jgi:GTPase
MNEPMQTDEDRQIERLIIHRDLVGWVINRLRQSEIEAERTTGNDENGDIRLLQTEKIAQAKSILRSVQEELDGTVWQGQSQTGETVYIEIKAYSATTVTSTLARQLTKKSTVMGVVTTAGITKPAKDLLNQADIAWIEQFPESYLGEI